MTGPALAAFMFVCLLGWVLTEDLGFLGGLGADPGSMIPMALLAGGGYLALTRVPAAPAPAEELSAEGARRKGCPPPLHRRRRPDSGTDGGSASGPPPCTAR